LFTLPTSIHFTLPFLFRSPFSFLSDLSYVINLHLRSNSLTKVWDGKAKKFMERGLFTSSHFTAALSLQDFKPCSVPYSGRKAEEYVAAD
jgi:hypothetical protein